MRTKRVHRIAAAIGSAGIVAFVGIAYIAYPKLAAQQDEFEAMQQLEQNLERMSDAEEPVAPKPAPAASSVAGPTAPATLSPAPPSNPNPPTTTASAPREEDPGVTGAEGSVNFREWVRNVRITGLRTGASPRILIGNASFDVGETVNVEFGIRFDGYDHERRVLRFIDATGVVLERRHP